MASIILVSSMFCLLSHIQGTFRPAHVLDGSLMKMKGSIRRLLKQLAFHFFSIVSDILFPQKIWLSTVRGSWMAGPKNYIYKYSDNFRLGKPFQIYITISKILFVLVFRLINLLVDVWSEMLAWTLFSPESPAESQAVTFHCLNLETEGECSCSGS